MHKAVFKDIYRITNMRFSLLLIYLILLFPNKARADSEKNIKYNRSISLKYGRALLWAHRPSMTHLVGETIQSAEVDILFKTRRNTYWKQQYNQPILGLRLHYSDLGNPDLGEALGVLPFFEFEHLGNKRLSLSTAWGLGLAWLTNRFDIIDNRKHIAIGSRVNLYVGINASLRYRINSAFSVLAYSQFTHFSNAAFSMPNLGINAPSINFGVSWTKQKEEPFMPSKEKSNDFQKRSLMVVSGIGFRSVNVLNEKRYPIYNVSLEYMIRPRYKWAWVPALDLYYNSAIYQRLEEEPQGSPASYNSQAGISVKYHQIVGPIELMTGMGVYILDKARRDGFLYHKLGARINLNEHWMLNTTLLSHWAKADHFELGLAYRIK